MTHLHLDADGCRAAILDYRHRLRRLAVRLRAGGRVPDPAAQSALAELRKRMDDDVHDRSTLEGQGAMTGLEARLLEPALRQARIALAFPARAEAADWLVHLEAADACFLVALSRLNGAAPRRAPLPARRPRSVTGLGPRAPRAAPSGTANPWIASNRWS
ncbi:MAG: hypothetical protein O9284_01395 [Steroidobacteraceae bacterium]|jgi:hypothetical protein|nr:hypothetical protein [Steroidobacteraceae bacterium]